MILLYHIIHANIYDIVEGIIHNAFLYTTARILSAEHTGWPLPHHTLLLNIE